MGDSEQGQAGALEYYLIHDDTLDVPSLSRLAPDLRLTSLLWDQRSTPPTGARVLLHLRDEQVRSLVPLAIEKQWELGVLPHPEAKQISRALGVKGSVEQVFRHYIHSEAIDSDVLTCNDQVVFSFVSVGETFALEPYDVNRPPTRFSSFLSAVKAARDLRLRSYKLTVGGAQHIQLAALGMVVLEHTQSGLVDRSFSDTFSINDGRMSLLVLAPRSIFGYLWFLLRLLLPAKIKLSRLPGSVGLVLSDQVRLEAPRGIDYSLDGTRASAETIEFRVLDERVRIVPGPALVLKGQQAQAKDKDEVKLRRLPVGETARQVVDAPLSLFSRAREDEYRDLFLALRAQAALSSPYLVLMILSVLLALTGLYANSAPVIIGAMILAPLMSPIVSLAMGLARTELSLIRNSLSTLLAGVGAGLACAVLVAWIMPLENLTTEMQARISPTLLDLGVAIISGIAGAYAHAKEEIAKSLAGVAIAVALVPPLSVAGIGVGWADWDMARGAFLLLTTNLVGIALAASATFLVMGFAPFKLARKGLAISLLLMAVIAAPLSIAFLDLVEQGKLWRQIPTGQIELSGQPVRLRMVKVRVGTPTLVRVVLSSPQRLDESHVDALKELISKRIGQPIELEAQLNIRR